MIVTQQVARPPMQEMRHAWGCCWAQASDSMIVYRHRIIDSTSTVFVSLTLSAQHCVGLHHSWMVVQLPAKQAKAAALDAIQLKL